MWLYPVGRGILLLVLGGGGLLWWVSMWIVLETRLWLQVFWSVCLVVYAYYECKRRFHVLVLFWPLWRWV